ncbi:HAD family hydrolase [Alteromonas sp. CYL-A6]|uniref:HAD family hydrolase n=1 Tax=Alteromonas nitratireducens TaxID=3390813 RepID=UPI0034BB3285
MDLTGISGVIFDLDGTLVESRLDFRRMRADVGCPEGEDILKFVDAIDCPEQQRQAHAIIQQHELDDARSATWLPNGKRMVSRVREQGLPMAIVTRNSPEATRIKLVNNAIPIDLVLTRDDAPPKPDPTALLMVARHWQLPPAHCLYVGDFIYDQQAAENAGMRWLLVD